MEDELPYRIISAHYTSAAFVSSAKLVDLMFGYTVHWIGKILFVRLNSSPESP